MRNRNLTQIEALFNKIDEIRASRIGRRLADSDFVKSAFPYHELIARRETAGLAAMQSRLMEMVL